jgi:hypothetical protein
MYPGIFPDIPTRSQVLDVIRRVNPQFNINDVIARSMQWRRIHQDRLDNNDPIFHLLFNAIISDYSMRVNLHKRSTFSMNWTGDQEQLINSIIQLLSDRFPDQFRVIRPRMLGRLSHHMSVDIVALRESGDLRDYLTQLVTDLYSSVAEYFKYWFYHRSPVTVNI